jgi:hypothetical protein
MAETQTGLTVYCPKCGHAGFRFQRVKDQSAVDLRDETNVRRHQPWSEVVAGLRMVCANPQCGHVLES